MNTGLLALKIFLRKRAVESGTLVEVTDLLRLTGIQCRGHISFTVFEWIRDHGTDELDSSRMLREIFKGFKSYVRHKKIGPTLIEYPMVFVVKGGGVEKLDISVELSSDFDDREDDIVPCLTFMLTRD